MKYTMKDITSSLPAEKAKLEPFWGRVFVRPISYLITRIFINTNVTPNAVSICSCICAIIATGFLCVNNSICIWTGAILINVWSLMDCLDGNIARTKKMTSMVGEFFDALGGYHVVGFSMIGFGMAAYHTTRLFEDYKIALILIGALGGLTDILSRLIYQKYTNNMMIMEVRRTGVQGAKTENDAFYSGKGEISRIKKIASTIDYKFGLGGNEALILLIAVATNLIDIFTLLYAFWHILGFCGVVCMYSHKMLVYEKEYIRK